MPPPLQYVAALNGPEGEEVVRNAKRFVRQIQPPKGWRVVWWLGDPSFPTVNLYPIFVVEKRGAQKGRG